MQHPSTETMDQIYKREDNEKEKQVKINLKSRKYKTMTGSIWDLGLMFELTWSQKIPTGKYHGKYTILSLCYNYRIVF